MKNDNNNNKEVITLLIIIILILSVLYAALSNEIISFNSNRETTINNTINQLADTSYNYNEISEEVLENAIEKQLFILFRIEQPITQIEDIDNDSKLLLALNMLTDEYVTSSNDISTTITSISKSKLEETFNNSVIYNLGIKHESFDIYTLTGGEYYNRNQDLLVYSKSIYHYMRPHASKVKNYEEKDGQYIITMNYLFPDDFTGFQYYYGCLDDSKNGTNSIIKAYDENGQYIDAQKYIEDNYDEIKDKLATHRYVFEKKAGKITLIEYSVSK